MGVPPARSPHTTNMDDIEGKAGEMDRPTSPPPVLMVTQVDMQAEGRPRMSEPEIVPPERMETISSGARTPSQEGEEAAVGSDSWRRKMLVRQCSNMNLLSEEQNDQFAQFVAETDGVWKNDLETYPSTGEHIESHADLYDFQVEGYSCTLRRNPFLAWVGTVQLPTDHPVLKLKNVQMHNVFYDVHGGISAFDAKTGIIEIDCHHSYDIAPYESWYKSNRIKQCIGSFAAQLQADGHLDDQDVMDIKALIPPNFVKGQNMTAAMNIKRTICFLFSDISFLFII